MGKMHCLAVGCSDATVIISATCTFLIDCHNIEDHAHLLPESKIIRAVFITHQHHDHFSGLQYLRDNGYTIGLLVYSPYERRYSDSSVQLDEWNEFCDHRDHFAAQGTALRAPYRHDPVNEAYWKIDGLTFWMLGPFEDLATSETRCLHDACLVMRVDLSSKVRVTFTGDASDSLLSEIASNTTNYCNGILHASHHGSINGAESEFIKCSKATHTLISTETGVHSNVPHATALARYEAQTPHKVYRTDVFGSAVWSF